MNLNNKYTAITGASSGIGYSVAKKFASEGKNLILKPGLTMQVLALIH